MKAKSILMMVAAMLLSVSLVFAQAGRSQGASERFDKDEVKTISGTITKVDHPYATLKAEDGKEYQVHMGPYWYWQREKYELKTNEKAQIKGEIDNVKGTLHLYPWEIVQDGKTMKFADDDGVPDWAGGRHGGCCQHGKGRGKR
ncbi:MAG: hypothetical protein ONB44_10920 [candidate division KSB1 bacterium]|nr:hypothetical protein [candidate division KSB1 bacterium]MDZ7302636.1 hypothetical protein [candidate division KSB1 bacterium]MDZ7311525.1 hypothetical protein [candidate division KSB1 bacterium]